MPCAECLIFELQHKHTETLRPSLGNWIIHLKHYWLDRILMGKKVFIVIFIWIFFLFKGKSKLNKRTENVDCLTGTAFSS